MFYCQRVCGDENFSIKEWNTALKYCDDNNIEGKERDFILNPELFPCEKQCFDCMAVVGKRRLETKKLNSDQNVQVSDTTEEDSSTKVD